MSDLDRRDEMELVYRFYDPANNRYIDEHYKVRFKFMAKFEIFLTTILPPKVPNLLFIEAELK